MKHRGFGALLMALPLSAAGVVFLPRNPQSASANSAPPYWEGATGAGAIMAGEQCPIQVEKEHLKLELGDLPSGVFASEEEFHSYGGKFTAEYTFYNPTAEDLDVKLVFPFGKLPEYAPRSEEFSEQEAAGYKITADGKDVPYELRYTYNDSPYDGKFDLGKELSRLYPSPRAFYSDDLPVHIHEFTVDVPKQSEKYDWTNFSLTFSASQSKTRLFASENFGFGVWDGKGKLIHSFDCAAESSKKFVIYVLGEDIKEVEPTVFRYKDRTAEIDADAVVTHNTEQETTFSELVSSFKPKSGISEEDFKNAFIDYIEDSTQKNSCVAYVTPQGLAENDGAFMRWFEYELRIPAGGKTVNTVTAPIYPTIDFSREQVRYTYEYLLSPADRWASFGDLTIDIETPYILSGESLTFTKREDGSGYTLTRKGLPMGDLTFTLTDGEPAENFYNRFPVGSADNNAGLVAAIVILSVLVAGAVVAIVLLTVQSRKRRRLREEEERKLLQARAQEGKIDLPEDEEK